MTRYRRGRWVGAAVLMTAATLALTGVHGLARETVTSLLDTQETVIGQPIAYPKASPAKVVSAIVTMLPGEETGWHMHDVPMFGYILEGEVTVDYGAHGKRTYRAGDAMMEALDVAHNGRNTGAIPVRILAVFMGANGVPDTVPAQPPAP